MLTSCANNEKKNTTGNGAKNTPGTKFSSATCLRLKRTGLTRGMSCHKTIEKLNLTVMRWCLYDCKINVFLQGFINYSS